MKQKFTDVIANAVLVIIVFVSGYWLGQSRWAPLNMVGVAGATPADVREEFVPFWEVWTLINTDYVDQPQDPEVLIEGAIEGMLATLGDRNTIYLSPSEQELAENSMQGELEGIGAEVESVDGAVTIVSPFEGSPAAEAGLQPRDIIRVADGIELTGMEIGEAAAIIRGPADTPVSLTIERGGELFDIVIRRGVIDIPSVTGEMLQDNGDGLAYIRLSRFGDKTTEELNSILADLLLQDPRGLILDLRRNPGGSLTTVVDVADQFLPAGVILRERFGDGREKLFEATDEGIAEDIPMVVLIDEGSASASEVLAGAVQDSQRGPIIGVTSFGKGTVQSWSTLRNGGGVRITIARWLTPDGNWIHETGLDPDITIELPEIEPGTATEFEDTQLARAIEYFNGELLAAIESLLAAIADLASGNQSSWREASPYISNLGSGLTSRLQFVKNVSGSLRVLVDTWYKARIRSTPCSF